MVERNMSNARYARHCRPARVEGHITRTRIASDLGYLVSGRHLLTPTVRIR